MPGLNDRQRQRDEVLMPERIRKLAGLMEELMTALREGRLKSYEDDDGVVTYRLEKPR